LESFLFVIVNKIIHYFIESCRGHFMCKVFPFEQSLGLTCLHAMYVCDGIQHCENGEDELPSECGGNGGHRGHGGNKNT
jgi:hypothetical protein